MSQYSPLYRLKAWRVLRAEQLRLEPLCRKCAARGIHTPANTADHVVPHKGNMDLFYDQNNLQSLCPTCHSSAKQLEERHGYAPGAEEDGSPSDPLHPWHRSTRECGFSATLAEGSGEGVSEKWKK